MKLAGPSTVGLLGLVFALALNKMAAGWSAGYVQGAVLLLSGTFVLVVASGIACAVLAWRASDIDPMMALRCE